MFSFRIRGALCGTLVLSGHIGVVISFALGAYSTYISYPIFAIATSILFIVIFVFFPETPVFLLKQNKIAVSRINAIKMQRKKIKILFLFSFLARFQEAEKSIRFYKNLRSPTTDQKLVDMEIKRLQSTINSDVQKHSNQSSFKWSEFLRNPGRKALIIGIVLAALNHITGSYALIQYTSIIFEASGSIISSNEVIKQAIMFFLLIFLFIK